ncbi:MAG: hypothetical protein WCP21_06995, partial [Armatimonadota bacterium]
LFTALVLLALVAWSSDAPSDRRALVTGIAAAAACLVRYNGLSLIITLAALVIVQGRREPLPHTLRRLALAVGVPALAVLGWLGRNRHATGAWEAYRGPGASTLITNLREATKSLLQCVSGLHGANHLIAGLLVVCLLASGVVLVKRWQRGSDALALSRTVGVLLFPLLHILLLCVLRTIRDFDPVGPRLLWPALPVLIAAGAAVFQRVLKDAPLARAVCAATVGLIVCGGLLTLRENVTQIDPQSRQEAQQRAQAARAPELGPLVAGKRVLVVSTWPLTIAEAGEGAAALWASSPYVFGVHHFAQRGPWRDWLTQIEVIVAVDPVAFDAPDWTARRLHGGAVVYVRRR